ncbi:hypothetical protein AB4455_06435 [Vibrio sp. 10N.261.46.E12]|uniref:hypothetical protein n=1 Tax=unclassified Vibrio TaxID=2614977 RepID=UPI000977E078|nr:MULTISPECIES: hypothetical protein [unclassified Vibrio]OMO37204.1 hypothetical protein BH584_23850 [Vibrio sp. 10N.261.45.E1]PMJ25763.1 hypothetical protein BCU27_09885 [Vibrio sp. 10N.286.45.B6]PML84442.1 hypothetical protein BCT66_17505 [Vibrio sp. 10N.261.49.E11]PMM90170.1 hypothetical protein BCT46_23680 [Vibrio sp. 10N.261.46.E8]PMN46133.1 hypothetical protein BCT32_11100 [Vibrio sp. 10N.261.45.E11]
MKTIFLNVSSISDANDVGNVIAVDIDLKLIASLKALAKSLKTLDLASGTKKLIFDCLDTTSSTEQLNSLSKADQVDKVEDDWYASEFHLVEIYPSYVRFSCVPKYLGEDQRLVTRSINFNELTELVNG